MNLFSLERNEDIKHLRNIETFQNLRGIFSELELN